MKPVVSRDTSHEHRHHHRFVESTHSASYSEWNNGKAWSSQEWKADELMDDRTEKPVVCPQRGAHAFQSRFSREHKHFILEEEEKITIELGNPLFAFNEEHSNSSLKTTKQNQSCRWDPNHS